VSGLHQLSEALRVQSDAAVKSPSIQLKIEKHAALYRGTLRLGDIERQVESEACADTAFALALILVITLDPDAAVSAEVSAALFSELEPAEEHAAPSTPAEPPVPAQPATPTPRRLQQTHQPLAVARPLAAPASESGVALSLQLVGGREFLGAVGWGAQFGLVLGKPENFGSLLLGLAATQTAKQLGTTRVQALVLALAPSACGHLIGKVRPWALDACLGAELGAVRVAAQETVSFRSSVPRWHLHGSGLLSLGLLRALGEAWRVGLSVQAGVGFQRDRYTAISLSGEETAQVVESRFTQRLALQVTYAF
jgi:hypothetical protein